MTTVRLVLKMQDVQPEIANSLIKRLGMHVSTKMCLQLFANEKRPQNCNLLNRLKPKCTKQEIFRTVFYRI